MGSNCCATFKDATFEECTLVVRDGTHVTLDQARLQRGTVGAIIHGAGSQVAVQGGEVTGVPAGLLVRNGAHLDLAYVSVSRARRVAVLVRDNASSNLSNLPISDSDSSCCCSERCFRKAC